MGQDKPVIGISAISTRINAGTTASRQVTFVKDEVLDLISDLGGMPIIIPNIPDPNKISSLVNCIDGLVLSGGEDLSPELYGEKLEIVYDNKTDMLGKPYSRPPFNQPTERRDKTEIFLYKYAKKRNLPIIGICRGMQLINVAEGGSLYQELPPDLSVQHEHDTDGFTHHHNVIIQRDTKIYEIFKCDTYITATTHHQAIKKLANNLIASGIADDGIIEYIESKDKNLFVIGLQGHPEKARFNYDKYNQLFKLFLNYALKQKKSEFSESSELVK